MESSFISVVIPALNEGERIGPLVKGLVATAGIEVIVADGGSADDTADLARNGGATVVRCRRGRSNQMNEGAARAAGEVMLFLHADTLLPRGFDRLVAAALADRDTVGGCFRFALDESTPFFRFITGTANFRSSRMGIVFGDQAIFVRSSVFRALGGFPAQPLLEDCEFVRRLRRRGRFTVLPAEAVTSSRRWKERGPLRTTAVNIFITWAYLLGVSPARLGLWHGKMARGRTGKRRSSPAGG